MSPPRNSASNLVSISRLLACNMDRLSFGEPVAYVYNPLQYAWEAHRQYLERYGAGEKEAVLLGMNPGPFGMAQTGIPFGDVVLVREWLCIEAEVQKPRPEHPKRPVEGFNCGRREVSGSRLWGWARARFHTPDRFFERFFVMNYCPLAFIETSGKNFTPDRLPVEERRALTAMCDEALRQMIAVLNPKYVIGVGQFARKRATEALIQSDVCIGVMPHPSPASPASNRGWDRLADEALAQCGFRL
ncbi:MAG: hypothetical protein AMXMBFR84_22630 [Candidatus Hydrogenedentota bacterium]